MNRVLMAVFLLMAGLIGLRGTSITHAAGNSDAAHMCEQSGYLNLFRVDGTSFKNAGDCTSYAAHGGKFSSGIPPCATGSNSGCITLTNLNAPAFSDSTLGTITLTGVYSFSPTSSVCYPTCLGPASGGGTYTLSSGSTFNGGANTGTFLVTSTTLTFYINNNIDTTCQNGAAKFVQVAVTFQSQSGTTSKILEVDLGPSTSETAGAYDQSGGDPLFAGPGDLSNLTFNC